MIERVARAISEADCGCITENELDRCMGLARAAIEAMREPTREMKDAALKACSNSTIAEPKASAWDAVHAYRAMITAALDSST